MAQVADAGNRGPSRPPGRPVSVAPAGTRSRAIPVTRCTGPD